MTVYIMKETICSETSFFFCSSLHNVFELLTAFREEVTYLVNNNVTNSPERYRNRYFVLTWN